MTHAAASKQVAADPIGPGRLVLVVGPSGAGKDTVLNGARAACVADPSVVFARRAVTRPASVAEEHDSIDAVQFAAARRDGAFALSWDAHGLSYGVSRAIDDDIRRGHQVVCNVSRGIVATARERYANVTCVLITASAEALALRLAARARPSDASLDNRIARNSLYAEFAADFVIDNDGPVADAVGMFLGILKNSGAA